MVRDIEGLAGVEAWQSKAADAFRSSAHDAIAGLKKAYHRYDIAADAVGTFVREGSDSDWASAVQTAQQQAAKALRDAQAAHGEQQAASKQLDRLHPDDPQHEAVQKRHDAAAGDVDAAKRELQAAKSLYEAAASTAAGRIHRAITHDGFHDKFGDKFEHAVGDAISGVENFADDVASAVASTLNAAAHDPLADAELIGGAILGGAGITGDVVGAVATATGAGAIVGLPAIAISSSAVMAGSAMAAMGGETLYRDSQGEDQVNVGGDGTGNSSGDWNEETARSLRDEDNYIRPDSIEQLTPDEMLAMKGRVFGRNTGDRMTVRTVRTKTDMDNVWDKLTDGAPKPPPDQKLAFYNRADGTRIQYRNSSSSGGETIDVFPPGGRKQAWKIHLPEEGKQ